MRGRLRLSCTIWLAAGVLFAAAACARASSGAADTTGTPEVKTKKVPLAMGLSVILPSAGQFYNGETEKAVLQLALIGAGFAIRELARDEDDKGVLTDPGSWVIALTWAWSVFDAPLSAQRINVERRRAAGLALSLSPHGGSPRLGVSLAF
jgi:hypothetical protein